MIIVDPLFSTTPFTKLSTPRCFRDTLSCHMMSTLSGKEGLIELVNFARRLPLNPDWIQYPNTTRQHFDLTESKRSLAIRLEAIEVRRGWQIGDEINV